MQQVSRGVPNVQTVLKFWNVCPVWPVWSPLGHWSGRPSSKLPARPRKPRLSRETIVQFFGNGAPCNEPVMCLVSRNNSHLKSWCTHSQNSPRIVNIFIKNQPSYMLHMIFDWFWICLPVVVTCRHVKLTTFCFCYEVPAQTLVQASQMQLLSWDKRCCGNLWQSVTVVSCFSRDFFPRCFSMMLDIVCCC